MENYNFLHLRDAAVLTTAYVPATVINYANLVPSQYSQLNVYITFLLGSLTDARIKIEFSNDGVTWFQETFSSISSGVDTMAVGEHKISADGNYRLSVPIKDSYIRVSVKGTGTVTSSSVALDAAIGSVLS